MGSDCDSELDACASKPCSDGQGCTDLTAAQQGNNVTGYVCGTCPVGYSDYNKKCVDTNECTESNGLCQHNCTNTEGSYICSCRQGFRLDATNKKTCTDVNECEEQTSQCKHTCKNTEGSYNCSCYEGYNLKSDGYTCELTSNGKRECEHCQHICLFNETTNTASCVCDKGYKPDPNNTTECLDINECELLNMPCSQSCNNTDGNFKCYCYTGFKLESDMVSCKACEIPSYGEDCAKTCQCNGRGSCNTVKGCVCDVNWTGVNCDIDVDECASQGSCPEGQLCHNTYGSFTCSCPTGYVFAGQVCNDTDECSNLQVNVTCDLRKEVCINTVGSYWCDCKQGYARDNSSTCQDIDECALHVDGCQHMCHNVEGRFNCECDYGYILEDNRKSCTRIRDLCVGHHLNCTHGCSVDDTNKPYCICPRGYTRNINIGQDTCIDINECTSPENNSCSYKLGCNNTDGGYTCSCPAGSKLENNRRNCLACPGNTWGPECSQNCACGIGAKICDPTTGCVCVTGFQGKYCTDDIDECEIHNLTCPGKQQCVNTYGSAMCVCPSGFEYDAKLNCVDINECSSEHSCTQICTNTVGSYSCSCYEGYIYNATTNTCLDIDECGEGTHKCHEKCVNTEGSYRCSCETGLFLQLDGVSCEVHVPCINTTSCSEKCANINGIETCLCGKGKVLATDKTSCDDLDLCKNTSCTEGCVETRGNTSFECLCNTGKYLAADGITCSECVNGKYGLNCIKICSCETANTKSCNVVDGTCECQSGWKGNNCMLDEDECGNGSASCQSHSTCMNTQGSFTCVCNDGFILRESICKECDDNFYGPNCSIHCSCGAHSKCNKTDGACYCKQGWKGNNCDVDIDECHENIHNCSSTLLEVCSNTEGGYKCVCNAGYTKLCDSCKCMDINECASAENNSCSYKPGCNNTDGGYTCSCPAGFKLDNNGRNCLACSGDTWGVGCAHNCTCGIGAERCDPVKGCVCKSGYTGDSCNIDINECTSGVLICKEREVCINLRGSAKCECQSGYEYDGFGHCLDINECSKNNDCSQTCINTEGSFSCSCYSGFTFNSTSNTCLDVDECQLGKHQCDQICTNTDGSYRCSCTEELVLQLDGVSCGAENPCTTSIFCTKKCANINGLDTCLCGKGKTLAKDNTSCDDMDLCKITPCSEGCVETKENKTFECSCNVGKYLAADGITCTECIDGKYGMNCNNSCTCQMSNTKNCDKVSGSCNCLPGWKGENCTLDVNECADDNVSCQEHSYCLNTNGSYICVCNDGFIQNGNMCAECTDGKYGKNCNNSCTCLMSNTKTCDKVNGSCICLPGWKGENCTSDVDECADNSGSCQEHSHCVNTNGSYICVCADGFILKDNICGECINGKYGMNCNNSCNCQMSNTETCGNVNGSCKCLSGWKGDNCTSDVDECANSLSSCQEHSHCVNTNGSYICVCDDGFILKDNICGDLPFRHTVSSVITIDYNMTGFDISNKNLGNYLKLSEAAQKGLLESLKKEATVISVTIMNLRQGSLIIYTDITMATNNTTDNASEMKIAMVLVEILKNGIGITINNINGNILHLIISGVEILKNDTPCNIKSKLDPCADSETCKNEGEEAVCRAQKSEESQKLLLGLSIGLPLFALLCVVIIFIVCYCKKATKTVQIFEPQ